jgi:uncharacterized membrane protein (DUF2068 family)
MLPLATKIDSPRAQKNLLRLAATFEFIKGIFVLLIGLSALLLVHKDAWWIAESLLARLHISTDRHLAQLFLDFADRLTDARLWTAVQLACAYSVLHLTEAYGLWKQRTWAEWVALVAGTLLMPLEIHGLMRGITVLRSTVFLGNLAIVLYMFFLLRTGHRRRQSLPSNQPKSLDQSGK